MTPGVLEDLFRTRTDRNSNGTISAEWHQVLLWRDIQRLIADGAIQQIECLPASEDPRERKYFRDLGTGEIYVHVAGWERGCPEFRKQS
jgi:hypothetical protein